ncbi:MAG: hypothetical protein UY93_C0004G0002 [Parcubacteria group bacterium GW2011_GWA1_56_13]|nr:MAG: hypothetical protein UY93_C0004G0002 [Parcubacteria group bacterium GW2011_GWA1_56_13]
MHFAYGAITLCGTASQQFPLHRRLITLLVQVRCSHLTTPRGITLSKSRTNSKSFFAIRVGTDSNTVIPRGLGFSLFARRYLGYHESCVPLARTYAPAERNSSCSLFLRVLRCFTSPGSLHTGVTPRITVQHCRVSPFGYLRIKGYKPPPRSFSQVSRVLLSRPRPSFTRTLSSRSTTAAEFDLPFAYSPR